MQNLKKKKEKRIMTSCQLKKPDKFQQVHQLKSIKHLMTSISIFDGIIFNFSLFCFKLHKNSYSSLTNERSKLDLPWKYLYRDKQYLKLIFYFTFFFLVNSKMAIRTNLLHNLYNENKKVLIISDFTVFFYWNMYNVNALVWYYRHSHFTLSVFLCVISFFLNCAHIFFIIKKKDFMFR